MKKPSFRIRDSFVGLAARRFYTGILLIGLCAGWNAAADIIYNNSTNDLKIRFEPGTVEVGDQIILAGTARYLTNFSFEYWGTSTVAGAFAGNVQACVRFYLNNGNEFNGYASPGTKFYDSGWFSIEPSERNVLDFKSGADFSADGLLLPASEMTWSVQFRGMGEGDAVGVDLYGPVTAGQNYPDYWERTESGWRLMANANTEISFAAVLMGSEEPAFPSPVGTVYNNSTNDLRIRFDPGTMEVGDQIVLVGSQRYLTNFSFEYWGTTHVPANLGTFAGNVEACVRFYINNGVEFNGYPGPGTKFYESGWFPVLPTSRNVVQFSAGTDFDPGGLLLPVSEFTWTVQFRGMYEGDAAGVDLYSPATVGLNYPDYWQRTIGGWQLMTNASTPVNFAAVFQASEVPAGTLPALQITKVGNDKVVVSWPYWALNYELQRSSQATGAAWVPVDERIYISGNNFVLTNNVAPGSTSFYRLEKTE